MQNKKSILKSIERLLTRNIPTERAFEFIAQYRDKLSNKDLRQVFVKVGREDLANDFIEEIDIDIDDKVISRMSAREGVVFGIHSDGDTVEVKWNEGGRQFVSKESLLKADSLSGIESKKDMKKVCTTSEPYKDMVDALKELKKARKE